MKKLISVVIPLFNEEEVISELGQRLKALMENMRDHDFEVIMVENGSTDLTFKKLKDLNGRDGRFKVVRLSRNFGCDGAISAGLRYAKGDAAVIMNADLQDPPEVIPEFLKKWEEGYEIVYGIIKKRQGVSKIRGMASNIFSPIMDLLTGGLFPRNVGDFRLVDKKAYEVINSLPEKNRFLRGMVAWIGFSQTGVEFERQARFAGEPKARFSDIVRLALDAIFAFSYFPLKVITILGATLSALSLSAIFIYVALFFIAGRQVPGFTTLITLMLFLFGMLFFMLGIIGEYLSRIYDEVKQRPNFIVKEKVGI